MTDQSFLPAPAPRRLGPDGPMVSPMAWGMWRFTGDDVTAAQSLVEAAFEAGITLFDTADIYGFNGASGFGDAEALLGRVFKAAPHLRGKMVLATKVTGGGRGMAAIAAHLRYISKNGRLEMEDERGQTMRGKDALHELADEYGVSAERIRQIEVAAMKKMKAALAEYA